MREIKFRGKRIDNGEWVYGYYGEKLEVYTGDYVPFIICPDYHGPTNHSYFVDYKVISGTVGQYTGLTDKNGKKIFEGDKVKMHYFFRNAYETDYGVFEDEDEIVGIVGIDEFGVYTEYNGEKWYLLSYLREPEEQLEVIGTIHEEEKL